MPHVGQQRPVHLDQPSEPPVALEKPPPPPRLSEPYFPKQPDSRGPTEAVYSEGYLLRCLIRHYGWHWLEAGVLRRPRP